MKRAKKVNAGLRGLLISGAVVLGVAGVLIGNGPAATSSAPRASKYIGADKCKNCHASEETGDQYGHWAKASHAKAFETLASDAAKAAGKERGVDDPQKADACLKCHVTAFGAPEDDIKKGFKVEQGVQCESCHGPGEDHMKARMKAAMSGKTDEAVPEGEISKSVPLSTCIECHNSESPSYKPFCYCKRVNEILHWNPKNHSAEEMKAGFKCACEGCDCMNGKCGDGCKTCMGDQKK